jgi:pentatricopeptide repeat protein
MPNVLGSQWIQIHDPKAIPVYQRRAWQLGVQCLRESHDLCLSVCLCRAWQLFDWVRCLPEGHDLCRLCDSNTYTTMITLCGPWQQLRRALQLIADMRSRGIECGAQARLPSQ